MRKLYSLLLVIIALMMPKGAWADVWQDPETKVNYEYTPGGSYASVKAGSFASTGSPEATGDIVILDKISVDGADYAVTSIGTGAFNDCRTLTSVVIPNSIRLIDSGAFSNCRGLLSVNIPNSVWTIGQYAFEICESLASISIPSSVISIGIGVFRSCKNLLSITVESGNTVYDSRDNCNAIIETASNEMVAGCNSTFIPHSVTSIGEAAFMNCSQSSIKIPNSVTNISRNAFYTTGLSSITLPNSIKNIDEGAFSYCFNLTEVVSEITEPFIIDSKVFYNPLKDATLYVPIGTKAKYEATEGWNLFKNIVEIAMLDPIDGETTVSTDNLGNEDLSDNVVNDVYYNVGSEGYDASDKSVVISQTTNMGQITDATLGSSEVKENFNGMILKVAKGKGLITVNVKTSGNAQLVVQVGNGTPMLASKTEKGDVVFRYDVEEDTYVYIYAIIGSSAAKGYGLSAADTDSSVRIYSITVSPGATGIRSIGASEKNDAVIYDLQGRRADNPAKGIYIVGGRKVSVK